MSRVELKGSKEERSKTSIEGDGFSVQIQPGCLSNLGSKITALVPACKYVIISDRNVSSKHADILKKSFDVVNAITCVKAIPPGEVSKGRRTKEEVEDWMASNGCKKDCCLVALGGGVIQDLGGFLASTYMMGIPFVGIPTSLVAMLECSVPREVGINASEKKNLVGSFVRPRAVFIDIEVLSTLSLRYLRDGMASAIRSAVLYDRELFALIDENAHSLQQYDKTMLTAVLYRAIKAKIKIMTAKYHPGMSSTSIQAYTANSSTMSTNKDDDNDKDRRRQQQQQQQQQQKDNDADEQFGHVVGDAIKELMSPMLFDGECLAIGLVAEMEIAQIMGYLKQPSACIGRVRRCLRKFYLPTDIPSDLEPKDLLQAIRRNQRRQQGGGGGGGGDSADAAAATIVIEGRGEEKQKEGPTKGVRGGGANTKSPAVAAASTTKRTYRVAMVSSIGKLLLLPSSSSSSSSAAALPYFSSVEVNESVLLKVLNNNQDAIAVSPTKISGHISVPGSISISTRVLLLAALGEGECRIKGLLLSDYTEVMITALRKLGISIEWEEDMQTLVVRGSAGKLKRPSTDLYMGNASAATRFITTVVNLIEEEEEEEMGEEGGRSDEESKRQQLKATRMTNTDEKKMKKKKEDNNTKMSGRGVSPSSSPLLISTSSSSPLPSLQPLNGGDGSGVVIAGNCRMHQRPISDLVDSLKLSGCDISYIENVGSLPLRINTKKHGWQGGEIQMAANVSSQFVSSIMMSSPYAKKAVTLTLESTLPVVSRQYIEITCKLMRLFGVEVKQISPNRFSVPCSVYKNPSNVTVEGDATAASYHLAMAAITGGTVTVDNVGSLSMQTDAKFCKLLEKMGCEIEQTESSTTVRGPGYSLRDSVTAAANDSNNDDDDDEEEEEEEKRHHHHRPQQQELMAITEPVDMGSMTDAFMTLAAVAALAKGSTRITNIKNQRYKDCNRLEVMVGQLQSIGVPCTEQEDGLIIHGNPLLRNRAVMETSLINPHEDSRIAMSFAVLACGTPGLAIKGKRCVDASYPSFWNDIQRELDAKVGAVLDPVSNNHIPQEEATVWLVGMRGVGKTTLGKMVAKNLGRPFIDLDHIFEIRHGIKIRAFVQKFSWQEFRARELGLFEEIMKSHARGFVIACGAGLVETPAAMEAFKRLPVVVQINRHIDDVAAYLSKDSSRPALLKDGNYAWDCQAIWEARRPLYRAASSYEFTIIKGDSDWAKILDDLTRFLNTVTMSPVGQTASVYEHDIKDVDVVKLVGGTFFLSLTFKNMREVVPKMQDLVAGNSAIELRVDLWESWDFDFIHEQIAIFRRHCCLPIVYTIRTEGQCGKFPNDEKKLFRLYELGIRCGCEFIDMEHHWSRAARHKLMRHRRHAKIIASAHFKNSNGGTEVDLENTFQLCAHGGRADVVKVVTTAFCLEDAIRLVHVAKNVRLPGNPPKIILAMGAVGQISRVFNEYLTPVTHALMPGIAAPGQLSIEEIATARKMLSIRAPMKRAMYIIGQNIQMSLAPLLFNTAFKYLHFEHEAKIFETKDASLDSILKLFKSPGFGGACISAPFKTEILPLLTDMSKCAREIGAVNSVAVLKGEEKDGGGGRRRMIGGGLYGHNTDWSSFYKKLMTERVATHGAMAIVVGSCGTARAACYALLTYGYTHGSVVVYDPINHKRAEEVANHFKCEARKKLENMRNVNVIIASFRKFGPKQMEDFIIPQPVIQQGPLVIDSRYFPLHTRLEDQAAVYGCNTLRGLDLLILQSIEQLKLWVGVKHWAMVESAAPVIDRAVRHLFYEKFVKNSAKGDSSDYSKKQLLQ